jgi:hypothetical protein
LLSVIRDPDLIPPSTEITTNTYIYDAFYEVESIVEQGGILDEDGMIILGIPASQVMRTEGHSPSKRARVENTGNSKTRK